MKKILFFGSVLLLGLSTTMPAIAQEMTVANNLDRAVLIAFSNKVYLDVDSDGNACLEDEYGNRVNLKEDRNGDYYFRGEDGDRVYLEEDGNGNLYFEDEDGDKVHVEEYRGHNRSHRNRNRHRDRDGDIYIDENGITIETR